MKNRRILKKLLVFMFIVSIIFGQYIPARAAAKNATYSITLDRTSHTLKKGKKVTLKATLNKAAKKKGIQWSSSNKKVATVSKSGKVTAKRNGKATITARVKGTNVKASCRITVKTPVTVEADDIPVTSVTVDQAQLVLKQGEEAMLTAAVTPSNATDQEIRWGSSQTAVAVVSENGTVRAVAEGTAVITATANNGIYAACTVRVERNQTQPEAPESGKILVAYFSWSGTSEKIAQNIIQQTGADSFRIERETPYSTDYNETAYGDAKEEAEANARPPIKTPLDSVAQYDKIILCYPIWWHTAPMTVGTFLESYDFSGKHIYPISQSASMDTAQYAQSVSFIRECAKGAVVDDGIFTKDNTRIADYVTGTALQPGR